MNSSARITGPDMPPDPGAAPRIASMSDTLASPVGATYRTRLATAAEDLHAAQRLRFEVFNVELREGLSESWRTQRDSDRFDATCDHLIIEHVATGKIVGTYRLQTGARAATSNGYYSEQEFDFTPFAPFRDEIVELGRACVHQDHRRGNVLDLLWRGIAAYTRERKARYLLGCSSLTSQDPALGHAMYARLAPEYLAAEQFRTMPLPAYALPHAEPLAVCPRPPRLLRTYLSVGSKICGPPALDREFGTIDFLTLIDLAAMPAATAARFLS
ncbi:MAG: GNAT family N-acyltransferase [Chthoniobacteraceae bacterium]